MYDKKYFFDQTSKYVETVFVNNILYYKPTRPHWRTILRRFPVPYHHKRHTQINALDLNLSGNVPKIEYCSMGFKHCSVVLR